MDVSWLLLPLFCWQAFSQLLIVCLAAQASALSTYKKDQANDKVNSDAVEAKLLTDTVFDEFLTVLEEIKETTPTAEDTGVNEIEVIVQQAAAPIAGRFDKGMQSNPKFASAVKSSFLDTATRPGDAGINQSPATGVRVHTLCMLGRPVIYLASGRFCDTMFFTDQVLSMGCSTSLRIPFEKVCAPKWANDIAPRILAKAGLVAKQAQNERDRAQDVQMRQIQSGQKELQRQGQWAMQNMATQMQTAGEQLKEMQNYH